MPDSRRASGGIAFLLVCIVGGVLLVGCVPLKERQVRATAWWAQITSTASGALQEVTGQVEGVVDMGKSTIDTVQEGAQDIGRRIDSVREGVEKLQEGKKLIEEGLGTNGE